MGIIETIKRKPLGRVTEAGRECSKCWLFKTWDEFSAEPRRINNKKSYCKSCANRDFSRYYDRKGENIRQRMYDERRTTEGLIKQLVRAAKSRAKANGLEFSITYKDVEMPEFCPVLGVRLEVGNGNRDTSASLDRIDNSKGYTPENIQIISNKANTMKSNASSDELLTFADWILREYKK